MASTTTSPSRTEPPEPRIILPSIGWNAYITLSDALGERRGLKLVYLDGSVAVVSPSRRHDWIAERLGMLVVAVANGCGIVWEDAGQATFRMQERGVGVEGDKTFYFGANAEQMLGPRDVDLTTQPPPDLAIEVEVTHSADQAIATWGRLGVPEVWRFDVNAYSVSFWRRQDAGTYAPIEQSVSLPVLAPADVLDQIRLADTLGSARWSMQLGDWVRDVLVPRIAQAR